ncbi:sensor domain-containing protein [Mycobacterium sp. WMMD1722]|uniref:sensor domain-containing protein n=1 Tax=Mycobacterium sp. WMMD1722 TaxID=3404117 RepID=UPI003BF5B028
MRHYAVIAGICVLVAGCATTSNATSSTPAPTMTPRPLMERELPVLLLSPEEVAAAMGSTPMTVTSTQTTMSDSSAIMEPAECLAIDGAAEAVVYANSGFTAELDESMNNGNDFTHYVKQSVVRFPYIEKAAEFFEMSVQQWPACHAYSHTQSGSKWTVGEIHNADGMLSTTATMQDAKAPGWGCGRALALRNNLIVDVNTCTANPADTAERIAAQIGEKIDAQW